MLSRRLTKLGGVPVSTSLVPAAHKLLLTTPRRNAPQWTSILRRCRTGKVRSAPGRIALRTLTIASPAAHKEALLPALVLIPFQGEDIDTTAECVLCRAVCDRTVSEKLMTFVYFGAAEHCCGLRR
jgi:hypothetical protein